MRNLLFIFVNLVLIVSYSLTFVQKAQAQNINSLPSLQHVASENQHVWVQSVTIDILSSLSCILTGADPVRTDKRCVSFDSKTNSLTYAQNSTGAIGTMQGLISGLYNKPPSLNSYIAYESNKFGLARQALAQQSAPQPGIGFGFSSISALLPLWVAFRNIAYLIIVLVIVVMGMLIMLRVKIDPRTVMTVENQIPKIIVGLILITFSFAIAGLLIDVMWLGTYVVINTISSVSPDLQSSISQLTSSLYGSNPIGFANQVSYRGKFLAADGVTGILGLVSAGAGSVSSVIASIFTTSNGDVTGKIVEGLISSGPLSLAATAAFGPLGLIIGVISGAGSFATAGQNALGLTAGGLGALIAFIILAIAVLWALFRLWFELLKAYVYILLHTVLSPFWIILGLLPGASINFEAWVRELLSNLVAFPATIGMFLLGKIFMDAVRNNPNQFVPPLVGNPGDQNTLAGLIGIGIILLTPQIVNILKDALKAPQFKYAQAIGQAVGVGAGAPGRVMGGGLQYTFGTHYDATGKLVGKTGVVATALRAVGLVH